MFITFSGCDKGVSSLKCMFCHGRIWPAQIFEAPLSEISKRGVKLTDQYNLGIPKYFHLEFEVVLRIRRQGHAEPAAVGGNYPNG